MSVIDPNQRLQHHLSSGTSDLRAHINSTNLSGDENELDRLERYYLYWKFYNGQHYRESNHTLIQFNYIKAFINKVNQFLAGTKGFTLEVKSMYSDVIDPEISRPIEEYLMYQWNRNNKPVVLHDMLQTGSVCGDVWVLSYWDDKNKFIKVRVLDSRHCFPIFKNGDISQLESFQVRSPLTKHPKGYKIQVTNYSADYIETWYQDTTVVLNPEVNFFGEVKKELASYVRTANPLKFIPIVHIKNKPQADSYYGASDCHDILNLNKVYNELHQELKGIIDYYATPTTVVTGATIKNMTRGLGNIWSGLPPEANVFTLGLDADISAMITFMDRLKVGMHEISDVPENVLGKIQSISGTSAAALQLTFLPLIQQADLKSLTYGEGISEINEQMLRIGSIYDKKNPRLQQIEIDTEGPSELKVSPVFSYGLPNDTMTTLQEGQYALQMNVISKRNLMNKLGVSNVEALMEEINTERLAEGELQAELQGMMSEAAQIPTDPNADLNNAQ